MQAVKVLRELLNSFRVGQRLWAATYLLVHDHNIQAESALTELASGDDIRSFGAEMTLRERWAGRLEGNKG